MAGITLASGFNRTSATPLDLYSTVADLAARNAIPSGVRYEGMLVYVESEETNYQLVGGILDANWTELSGGGGTTPPDTGKVSLANNASTDMPDIGEYLTDASCLVVDYYLYRRTDSGFKSMSGRIYIEGQPDGATNPDKWTLFEAIRSERGAASGVTFSLDDVDTEKSILVATLDDYAGTSHECEFYYEIKKLRSTGESSVLANNASTTISNIGEYLVAYRCIIVNYYIYRRTDSGYKSMSGKLFIEGQNDAVLNPDKWTLFEAERSESGGASGVVFSLDDIDTEKSVLVATLDDFTGANHDCTMYYELTKLVS